MNYEVAWEDLKETVKCHKKIHAGLKMASVSESFQARHADIEEAYINIMREMKSLEDE